MTGKRKRTLLGLALAGFVVAASVALAADWRSELDARSGALAADDARGRVELALWAFAEHDDRGFDTDALDAGLALLEAALEIDPAVPHAPDLLETYADKRDAHHSRLNPDYWAMAFSVIGGLGLFLLGMKNMSEGMQAVAGQRLRRMISAVTENRVLGVGTGTLVTMMVQSSSISTVIVIGFVNGGLMALHQAIAVIMGANIGTTITGWILVLKIGKYGLPIIGVAGMAYLFARTDRWRYLAMAILGLGLVFFGLEMMKDGFKPMRDVPAFREAFLWFSADNYFGVLKCAFVGCILTFLVQSSSATLGITIGLASQGVIPFETAAALVLGENIGTTITAWLASIGATTNAKRAAYAHVLFNLLGVAWITAIFGIYIRGVASVIAATEGISPMGLSIDAVADPAVYAGVVTAGIAATHTGFNLVNVLIFLPFVRVFAALLERLVPGDGTETSRLSSLDVRMIESPMLGIEQARAEVLRMADSVDAMHGATREVLTQETPDREVADEVFRREGVMDEVQLEVIGFVTNLITGEVPHAVADEARQMLRLADEYESISDYVSAILKSYMKIEGDTARLSEAEMADVLALHDAVAEFVGFVTAAVRDRRDVLVEARARGDAITHRFKDLREAHLLRVTSPEAIDPGRTLAHGTMLNAYRKIKDHALNIAEAISAERGIQSA